MLIGGAGAAQAQAQAQAQTQTETAATETAAVPVPAAAPALPSIPGVAIRLGVTNFYQGLAAGSGQQTGQFAGKADAVVTADLSRFGAWDGLSVTAHGEYNYGQTVNHAGGTLLPVNTAEAFPGTHGQSADLSSFFLSQRIGTIGTVSVGKINMLDLAARTPLRGGGGIETFQNIALAAPVTGLVPPYIYGAMASLRTPVAIFGLIVFDPESAIRRTPDRLFATGVSGLGSMTVPVTPFGLTGTQGVKLISSTKQSVDLRDIPQLILPSSASTTLRGSQTPWFASYSFQQYLIQDKTTPGRGWGVFGEVGVSDANPTPISNSATLGFGGNSLFPGRGQDRFGVAAFRYVLSRDLRQVLSVVGRIRPETGIETFYNAKLQSWLDVSADLQVIEPALPGLKTAVVAGLRTRIGL